ncbi:spermatogenesis-associated protein 17 [Gadus morhua]|uniref:spermatogenesis-associated protein 17 n=1 Tax=Gadus morhua TaxID=8049 RepID=UPI0011B81156|nr:spermatogenesis-associated protein 17 [Gadus morhua]
MWKCAFAFIVILSASGGATRGGSGPLVVSSTRKQLIRCQDNDLLSRQQVNSARRGGEMAGMLRLRSRIGEVEKEYYRRNRLAEENRPLENGAATRIQSCFRGCRVRAYLRHLHKKATIIQKRWRGFSARARLRQMVKVAYFIMKIHFYEAMAVRVCSGTISRLYSLVHSAI